MTNFCLRDKLYRDTAPVPFSNFIYREKYSAIYQTCTAIAPARNKICTGTAKSTPYLSCTGTYFCLKYQDPARMLRQVTQPPFIAGPLAARQMCTELTVYQDFANAQARVLQPFPATVPSLQNTCFLAYPMPQSPLL